MGYVWLRQVNGLGYIWLRHVTKWIINDFVIYLASQVR